MVPPLRSAAALMCLVVAGWTEPAGAQNDVSFPPRPATEQDAKLLSDRYGAIRAELDRMGLHQTIGHTCRTFVTVDSVRPVETPLPLGPSTVTLPYASFLIWGADRRFDDSVLYHVFAAAEAAYTTHRLVPPGTDGPRRGSVVKLAPREPYPTAAAVAADHDALAGGPFRVGPSAGGLEHLEVKPYLFPVQNDDPASVLPRKREHVLQVTCLSDPDRVTNCLCAGTD